MIRLRLPLSALASGVTALAGITIISASVNSTVQTAAAPYPVETVKCFEGTTSTGQDGCNKLPTSLPCVNGAEVAGGDLGFVPDFGSYCGFRSIFIFAVACGAPSTGEAC